MANSFTKRSRKAGMAPGTLVHIGETTTEQVSISILDYVDTHFEERSFQSVEECFPFKDTASVTWINVDGVHQVDIIEKLGNHFNLHPLIMEDIANTEQRPKTEEHSTYIYVVLNMLYLRQNSNDIEVEQISLVLGSNFVLSFQERAGDVFDSVRKRIRANKGRIRKYGSDYLVYCLIDAVVDNYFVVLEKLEEDLEDVETRLSSAANDQTLQAIRRLKKEMVFLRKTVWPIREVSSSLHRSDSGLIQHTTTVYLKDVYDHTIQVIDTIESMRDMLSGLFDIYLSSISNRMNEVMKILTIFASIFIPLTFIAGVYGMNFHHMPELEWRWGYFGILGFMAAVGVGMLAAFKWKRWF